MNQRGEINKSPQQSLYSCIANQTPQYSLTTTGGCWTSAGGCPRVATMLFDNDSPRYLPHLQQPEVLAMGLSPLRGGAWIETDNHLARYHQHKLAYREHHAGRAYRGTEASLAAQREWYAALLRYLTTEQADLYQLRDGCLHCAAGEFRVDSNSDEPLWDCSLWVADDLVIMEAVDGVYHLTAASLCSPSHWRLEEKFNRPMREIHDPIPGFHQALTPRIDRFFEHLKPEHPVVRFNWAIQSYDDLSQRPEQEVPIQEDMPLYYRSERQSLLRLPQTGAIAFTIRVYLHPLASLAVLPGALPALFAAIDATPAPLAHYKGFPALAPALQRYRRMS